MEFHERLKWLRKYQKCTQVQLAQSLNITERHVQRLEAKGANPNFDTLQSIADFFGVPLDFLAGRGVFSCGEVLLNHRDEIIQELEKICPFVKSLNLSNNFSLYLSILPVLIHEMKFDEEKNQLHIYLLDSLEETDDV